MDEQIQFFKAKLTYEIDAFDLYTALNSGEHMILIDTRQPSGYENEHLPGAINLPYAQMNADTTKDFDRDPLYITYCQGIECNGSTKGALNMSMLGFKIRELIGGIASWKLDGFATEGKSAQKGLSIECAC